MWSEADLCIKCAHMHIVSRPAVNRRTHVFSHSQMHTHAYVSPLFSSPSVDKRERKRETQDLWRPTISPSPLASSRSDLIPPAPTPTPQPLTRHARPGIALTELIRRGADPYRAFETRCWMHKDFAAYRVQTRTSNVQTVSPSSSLTCSPMRCCIATPVSSRLLCVREEALVCVCACASVHTCKPSRERVFVLHARAGYPRFHRSFNRVGALAAAFWIVR